ncbi:MAG TPA: ABC transporter permease [Nocardiopsis listeri]|uniref:FtsX-like permease family protein n=1 Tax=Nocardiopsis listeri TaxID=53440 RepID=UPI001DD15E42|nr:ABC transporter permease [Nocardiopsis listeri]HJE61387.1 ABC transporter permease [Nocardiopsis listeri]
MLDIAWKTLRARKGSFVGAFIALLCGSALLVASGVLVESGLRASVSPHRYAAADAVVGGQERVALPDTDLAFLPRLTESVRLPSDLVETFGDVDGVASAIGDHHLTPAVRSPRDGMDPIPVTGHDWATAPLGPFEVTEGAEPVRTDEVALETALAAELGVDVGDPVEVVHEAEPRSYRVSGLVTHASGGGGRQGTLFLSSEETRLLAADPEAYDTVGVLMEQGADPDTVAADLEAAADDIETVAYTGALTQQAEFTDLDQARGLLLLIATSFGGLAVLIALFVVSGTLALSIDTRKREFAALRAIGATPTQVLRMVGSEVLLLSLVAGVLGCLPGFLIAETMRGAFVSLGVLPADLPLVLGPLPAVGAVLSTVLTALVGGMVAAARPATADPVEALRESSAARRAPGRWRITAGLVCLVLGAGAAMAPVALRNDAGAAGTGSATLLLVIGVAFSGPFLLVPLVSLITRPLRAMGAGGFLAAENSAAEPGRLSTVLTPLVLAIGVTLSMVYTQTVLSAAVTEQTEAGVRADALVVEQGSGGMGSNVLTGLAALPETGTVAPLHETGVFVPYSVFGDPDVATFTALGVAPGSVADTLDPGVAEGSLDDLTTEAVALETSGAALLGASVGDEVEVVLGDGQERTLRLVATYERGLGLSGMLLPQEVLEGHTGPPSRALVNAAEGTSDDELSVALADFAAEHPTLDTSDRQGFADGARAEADLSAWVNLVGLGVILAYIAIAVVNSLVMSTAARSREFALLMLIGATRGQVLRAMRGEAAVAAVLATLIGTVTALVPLTVLSMAFLGTPVPPGSPLVYVGVVGGACALGVLSVMLPVRLALRAPPVESVNVRE